MITLVSIKTFILIQNRINKQNFRIKKIISSFVSQTIGKENICMWKLHLFVMWLFQSALLSIDKKSSTVERQGRIRDVISRPAHCH